MKISVKLLLLKLPSVLTLIMLLCSNSFAQPSESFEGVNEPFKGAREIMVTTALPDAELFGQWGNTLIHKGYYIDFVSDTFHTINTVFRYASDKYVEYKIYSHVKDGILSIRIKYRGEVDNSTTYYDWQYRHGSRTHRYAIYSDVMKLVEQLNGNVTYK